MSASYLFITWEGGGNVPPVLGAARRLAARGHRVRVVTEPCLRDAVEAAGATFIPFTEHFTRTDRREVLMRDWEASSPPGAIKDTLARVIHGPAEPTAQAVERALDAEATDAIVTDWLLPVGVAVGEARGIPSAVLVHCVQMRPAPGRPPLGLAPMNGFLGRLRDAVLTRITDHVFDTHLDELQRRPPEARAGASGARPGPVRSRRPCARADLNGLRLRGPARPPERRLHRPHPGRARLDRQRRVGEPVARR